MRAYLTEAMKNKLTQPNLVEQLVPQYGVGCRRPTPGVGYMEALTADSTELVFGDIQQVTTSGIVDRDCIEHPVDIIVCATGFDTTFKPRFPLIGIDGKSLEEEWAESTEAYMATAISEFPNYFMFFGPNNPFASGSYISAVGESLHHPKYKSQTVLTLFRQNAKQITCSSTVTAGRPKTFAPSLRRKKPSMIS